MCVCVRICIYIYQNDDFLQKSIHLTIVISLGYWKKLKLRFGQVGPGSQPPVIDSSLIRYETDLTHRFGSMIGSGNRISGWVFGMNFNSLKKN